jgi:hypothetical protein
MEILNLKPGDEIQLIDAVRATVVAFLGSNSLGNWYDVALGNRRIAVNDRLIWRRV